MADRWFYGIRSGKSRRRFTELEQQSAISDPKEGVEGSVVAHM
jgi:hypothetical protein